MPNLEIIKYYDDIAPFYDKNRFSNSYGRYIHKQELRILEKYLDKNKTSKNLDLACGTGRFLDYADFGIDLSSEMVNVSRSKFLNKNIQIADAEYLPFDNESFKNVFSLHLLMHLKSEQVRRILSEVHRVLISGGLFIFDIPSEKRRKITGYKNDGWHGAHHASVKTILEITTKNWELEAYYGLVFFPIHRIPIKYRKYLLAFDSFLGKTIIREYSSHLIFILKKR